MKTVLLWACSLVLSACGSSDDPGYSRKFVGYALAKPDETSIKVSLWDQKAWLLNGEGKPILQTDVATGVPGKDTPTGVFPVLERLEEKRSNRYGRIVDRETREVVHPKSWEFDGPIPENCEYEGIEMPYWIRLTWDGVGMHVGTFEKRTRCSFGCIRVYEKAQPLIFRMTQEGTEVEVVEGSLVKRYGL